MADENTASYAKIGLIVVLGVAAIVLTLIYLGGLRGQDDLVYAETYYDKPISGLSVGSTVNFRGVKVGKVAKIGFVGNEYNVSGDDNQRIYVLMAFPRQNVAAYENERLSAESYVRYIVNNLSARATVTASGITGLSRIEIDFNKTADPPRPISWTPRTIYIPSGVSLLDNFSDSATKVMSQINKMDIAAVWSNINASVSSLAQATESAKTIIETQHGEVDKISTDLSDITYSLREFSNEVRQNPSLLVRERIPSELPETARP